MIDDSGLLTPAAFQGLVWEYYRAHGRYDLPWRQLSNDGSAAYEILVSELMLQQTQVARVVPKYQQFLQAFPTLQRLADAPIGDVLRVWSGLGYNRRAKYLQQAAQAIMRDHQGKIPDQAEQLVKLPGVGANTAGAVLAYAFNQPCVFVETNIRTVFIHHFFNDQTNVSDKIILELVAQTLVPDHPREWYWALMDYGAWLKQSVGNLNRQSKNYTRQSVFKGSRRQVRGQIIRLLGATPLRLDQLQGKVPDPRLAAVLEELLTEQLIRKQDNMYLL